LPAAATLLFIPPATHEATGGDNETQPFGANNGGQHGHSANNGGRQALITLPDKNTTNTGRLAAYSLLIDLCSGGGDKAIAHIWQHLHWR
jgi:hypothetical protein